MERIQAAIAKARQARRSDTPAIPSRQPGNADAAAAWDALPTHRMDPAHMERMRLVDGSGRGAEFAAFDVMRTRALKLMQANGWKSLAITSPTAGCGKSTVALNLGFSLTRRDDVSALLLEADLRRPSLAEKLRLTVPHDAAGVLQGEAAFADNACRLAERLAVSTAGQALRNPSDLLQSPRIGPVMAAIAQDYAPTLMMFDTPPLLVTDDTLGFLQHVDCALLIAAAEQTTMKDIDTCEREIASHTNVLGVVLNKCKMTGERYGYDYYS